jgi:hypothetical protein
MATRYAIRGGVDGKRRLDLLAQTMASTTDALLAQLAFAREPGASISAVGAGT